MNDSCFVEVIESDPYNPTPRLVYADWLDEQGDPRGELIRIQEELRRIDVPNRAILESRMQELLNEGVEPLVVSRKNSIGMKMIFILPGEFIMGSPANEAGRRDNEDQVHVALTEGFWISQTPVSQEQWKNVMDTTPWSDYRDVKEGRNYPATYVSWEQTLGFCEKLTKREKKARWLSKGWEFALPTEAQWEYACRAGTTTPFSFGHDPDLLKEFAWVEENAVRIGEEYAHLIGVKKPNPWGLLDLHGNVWEICWDWFRDTLPGGNDPKVIADPRNNTEHVTRGGSFYGSYRYCRSANRGTGGFLSEANNLGFRISLTLSK